MAKSKNHVYSIDLNLTSSQASKQALKELQTAFADSNNSMEALNASYANLAKHTEDSVALEKQYSKVVANRLKDRDAEIDKLQAEKVAIMANKDLTEEQKNETIALKDAEIKRLEADKKYIKAKEKEAKLIAKMNKVLHSNLDENSKSFKLAKNVVSLQEKLNNLLGKESKLRQAASKVAAAGAKTAKVGLKAMGGAMAAGGAVLGLAAGAAQGEADKERAIGSLKSGIDPSVLDTVYIKSGADYSTIVAAVNNLSDVTKDNALLVQGAVLELQNPGIGKLLLSTSNQNAGNITKLNNAIAQIKKQTGSQDLSAAIEASTKSKSVTTGTVSQTEYIQAYAALAQQGFEEEQINRIIRSVSSQNGNFVENLNKTDLSKFTRDQQMKVRLSNTSLDLKQIDTNKSTEDSSAQSVSEKLRQFELKKNELLVKLLPVVDKVLTEFDKVLDSPVVDKIANGLVKLFTSVIPLLEPILNLLEPILDMLTPVLDWFNELVGDFVGTVLTPLIDGIAKAVKNAVSFFKDDELPSGGQKAQGGIITSPTLVGEAGPELVLPLDYSRAGRSSQIIQNFNTTQSFNMAANQQTPLAFSQAVGTNKFITRVSH